MVETCYHNHGRFLLPISDSKMSMVSLTKRYRRTLILLPHKTMSFDGSATGNDRAVVLVVGNYKSGTLILCFCRKEDNEEKDVENNTFTKLLTYQLPKLV